MHAIAARVQARLPVATSDARLALEPDREQISKWLGGSDGRDGRPLRLQKVHTLLTRKAVVVTYATLRRHVIDVLGRGKPAPTVRVEDGEPGDEAEVDFGEMGFIVVDRETGQRRKLWALIITLTVSRYMFVWPTLRQRTAAVCEGLDAAWAFFGGMPRVLIPDNTKAMVRDPKALALVLVDVFLDRAQTRGLFVDAARVRRPKDKARVENQVAYVRESWFDGERFFDLDEARTRRCICTGARSSACGATRSSSKPTWAPS